MKSPTNQTKPNPAQTFSCCLLLLCWDVSVCKRCRLASADCEAADCTQHNDLRDHYSTMDQENVTGQGLGSGQKTHQTEALQHLQRRTRTSDTPPSCARRPTYKQLYYETSIMEGSLLQPLYAWKKTTLWSALHMCFSAHKARPLKFKVYGN